MKEQAGLINCMYSFTITKYMLLCWNAKMVYKFTDMAEMCSIVIGLTYWQTSAYVFISFIVMNFTGSRIIQIF